MLNNRVVVCALILAFSAMFVEKLDAKSYWPTDCGTNEEPGCLECSGGTCESLSIPVGVKCLRDICYPACVCKKDCYRLNDKCVPVAECNVQCPPNMQFNKCVKRTALCNGEATEHQECKSRCECKEGFIFSGVKTQDCIPISQCPKRT